MKIKLLLSAFIGMAAWSLSSVAAANWDSGPCPQPHQGPAPCIEMEDDNGDFWHFNGDGSHAGVWHEHPLGGDLSFSGSTTLGCDGLDLNCTLTLSGEVKKCQDSDGNWRIGVRVNNSTVEPGDALCDVVSLGGFPWYSRDDSIVPHCPFEDDCDTFIPYDPNASTYTANFGEIDINVLFPRVTDGHVHGVVFTPGNPATFSFNSDFFNCDEEDQGCSVNGTLSLDNATSLEVY